MKKIASLILALAMVASMAVCASAKAPVVLGHDHSTCEELNGGANDSSVYLESADKVKVLSITEGTKQTLTTCKQAITNAELTAVCDANEDIKNLTVFRQRNVTAEGAIDLSVKLWNCNPARKHNQAVVVLFRAEGAEEWTVVGTNNVSNVCDVTLPGSGAYVVALAY